MVPSPKAVPPEWYGGDVREMERLVEQLMARRLLVRGLVDAFRCSDREPFPNWGKRPGELQEGDFGMPVGMGSKRLQ